ncbi:DNA translocase FtsK [Paracoccus sp. p3-h83]|uniref:DNA translocase FtsK n=1 Tax=Paracoccus sp. p3-h83 TaxID=3342805 RepID=UPI0035BACC21
MTIRSPHYDDAVAAFRKAGKVSTSFLQRTLGLGYAEAAAIVGQLERDGIVTRPNHVGRRDLVCGHYDPNHGAQA